MGNGDARTFACTLLQELGPPEAWQHSTREAIDAILRHDDDAMAYWATVQQELTAVSPRPGAANLDIQRSARMMVAERQMEAWTYAMQKSVEVAGNLSEQVYWLRVADAVNAIAHSRGKEGV